MKKSFEQRVKEGFGSYGIKEIKVGKKIIKTETVKQHNHANKINRPSISERN